MSLEFLAGFMLGAGIAAIIAFNAGIKEGLERAARHWRGRRAGA